MTLYVDFPSQSQYTTNMIFMKAVFSIALKVLTVFFNKPEDRPEDEIILPLKRSINNEPHNTISNQFNEIGQVLIENLNKKLLIYSNCIVVI